MNNSKESVIFIAWPWILITAMTSLLVYAYCIDSKKSMGYGGSPGHMTPMEIEELGNRSKKP